MNKLTIIAGAALVAAAGVAVAQSGGERPDRNADVTRQQAIERAEQRFGRLDLDNDGRVTPEEARQAHERRRAEMAGRLFDRLDADDDGSVSRAEFDRARTERAERRADRGTMGMRGPRHGMRGMGLFGEQGFVTREQMRERALARFDRLDADRDGTLTAAERRQARAQHRRRMMERRGGT